MAGLVLLLSLWVFPASLPASETPIRPALPPQRLVSLGPQITENIFLLGAGERLVGNTIYCQRPEAARRVEKVGSVLELSIEKIVSLQPHLILASNLTPPQQVAALLRLGLPVETFDQPDSFAGICAQLLRLGQLLHLEDQAEKVVAQAQAQVEAVQRAVSPLPRRRVLLQVGANPLFAAVPDSFTHDFIELGGGINVAGDQLSGALKTEQVLASNPELIIIAIMGSKHGMAAAEKKRWLHFATLEATRTNRVHVIDPDRVCSPSALTFAQTLLEIARLIHPEADLNPAGHPAP